MGAIRVLLVEDNEATRELLKDFIGGADGLEVCGEAHDGKEGLALLAALHPDLVLLDLIMPGTDGLGFLRSLEKMTREEQPKIIVLSGVGADEYVQRACELGANYYLVKPLNLVELASHIELLFPREEQRRKTEGGLCAWLLLRLGANRKLEGYRYACYITQLLLKNGKERVQMKELYLQAGQHFGTSYSCVERNLRTLVRNIHTVQDPLYTETMGFGGRTKPPENGMFLRALAESLDSRTGKK